MPINPGKLDKFIRIQQHTPSNDPDTNEKTWEYVDFYSCWAEMMPLVGKEVWSKIETMVAEATAKFKIRFFPGIVPTMIILYADTTQGTTRKFEILGLANPYEGDEFLDLYVKEIK